jgi:hypothetical protein
VVARRLPDVIEVLERLPAVYIALRPDSFHVVYASESRS